MDHEIEALVEQLGDLRALVGELTDEDMAQPSRCTGWSAANLIWHLEGILLSLLSENTQAVAGEPEITRYDVYTKVSHEPYPFAAEGAPVKTSAETIRDRVLTLTESRRPTQLRTSFGFALDGAKGILPNVPGDRVVMRPPAYPRMTFRELVASRHMEFGVHTMDIAHATGRPETLPKASAAIITDLLDRNLGQAPPEALGWDPIDYILVGCGRRELLPAERETLGPLAERFPLM